MPTEYILQLRVVKASALPKTDRFSKIDPYFKILVGNQKFKTKTKDDDDEPVFDQVFYPVVPAKGYAQATGRIEFQLYDKDLFGNSFIGTASLDLDSLGPGCAMNITLPITMIKEKHASRPSTVTVSVEGMVQSYTSLRNMYKTSPGVHFNDAKKRLYVPIVDTQGLVYVGVEHEEDRMDLKVFVTQPSQGIFIDMAVLGREKTKVRRRVFKEPVVLAPGLVAFEEVKLDDIPISTDFNQVMIMLFSSTMVKRVSADDIVSKHGWTGALNFQQATRILSDIDVDYDEEEIYMSIDKDETYLLVDWDDTDADLKLAVIASPATASKAFDLTIRGSNIRKTSEIYAPPRVALGKYTISRMYQLDDLPFGTSFADIEIGKYEITNPRQYNAQAITRVMG